MLILVSPVASGLRSHDQRQGTLINEKHLRQVVSFARQLSLREVHRGSQWLQLLSSESSSALQRPSNDSHIGESVRRPIPHPSSRGPSSWATLRVNWLAGCPWEQPCVRRRLLCLVNDVQEAGAAARLAAWLCGSECQPTWRPCTQHGCGQQTGDHGLRQRRAAEREGRQVLTMPTPCRPFKPAVGHAHRSQSSPSAMPRATPILCVSESERVTGQDLLSSRCSQVHASCIAGRRA